MGKSDLFTLYLNHGGYFSNVDGVDQYIGGYLTNKWGFDRDKFGYFDLVDEFEQLGYIKWSSFWFRIPKTQDFQSIKDDKDVMDMLSLIGSQCRIMNVYIEGGKKIDEIDDPLNNLDEINLSVHVDDVINAEEGSRVGEKGKNKVDDVDSCDSDDSEFIPFEDDLSDVSLGDLDFISDDEYAQAKFKLKKSKHSNVFDLVDEFGDCDQIDLGGPPISDYEDSDGDVQSSETDEDGMKFRKDGIVYDPKCNHNDMHVVLGMHFQDGLECRKALRTWAIENGRHIRFRKVTKANLTAKCTPPCPWKLYASEVKATRKFIIKTIGRDHQCPLAMTNKMLTSKWIAKRYLNVFRVRYDMKISDLREDIVTRFNISVPKDRLYKAKNIAQLMVRGTVESHYGSLRRYLAELRRVDREGRFELLLGDGHVFKGLYIGFSALRKGFLASCRPFLGLDGCHPNTYMKGILLCAVAKDGNNRMFPVAWAAVEVENENCWEWFLKCLLADLGITDGNGWIFMSDQQKGLQNALKKLVPHAEHRNCARHIYANYKKHFKGETLKNMFWRACRSTYVEAYKYAIQMLRNENQAAFQNFMSRDTSKFCQAFISTHAHCGMIENNIAETFNGLILKARGKHLIQMLKDIRNSLMDRQVTRFKELMAVNDRICPRIRQKLEDLRKESIHCHATAALFNKFEVDAGGDKFSVDINARTCSCRGWELSGIPCVHGISAIHYTKQDPADFVDEWFTVSKVLEAYNYALEPINGQQLWPEVK